MIQQLNNKYLCDLIFEEKQSITEFIMLEIIRL